MACPGHGRGLVPRHLLQFVEVHAGPKQVGAPLGVAGVHGAHIGRRQRVGEDAHSDARVGQPRDRRGPALAGHEVRRDEVERRRRPPDRLEHRGKQEHVPLAAWSESLGGVVVEQQRGGPDQRHFPGGQFMRERRRAGGLDIGRRGRVGEYPLEPRPQCRRVFRPGRSDQARGRVGGGTVPVEIELAGDIVRRLSDGHHVDVPEPGALPRGEVFVADVAPPDYRRLIVHRERLVVHAAIEPLEIRQVVDRADPPVEQGVVEPHLDIRMGIERRDGPVLAAGVVVVEEQAHPHAPVGRPPQGPEERHTHPVAVPHVVLGIDRSLGSLGEEQARPEGFVRIRQEANACQARVGGRARCEGTAEASRIGIDKGVCDHPTSGCGRRPARHAEQREQGGEASRISIHARPSQG